MAAQTRKGETTPAVGAVFITGTGHSGSTLLALLLGGHQQLVGLGDVTASILQNARRPELFLSASCSCGAAVERCEFWGPTAERLDAVRGSLEESYEIIATSFRDRFGPGPTLVDASRNVPALRALSRAGVPTTAIHLLRDVRSWTISMLDRDKRPGQRQLRKLVSRYGVRGVSRRLTRFPSRYFRLWHRQNQEIRSEILAMDLPFLRLGYEEFATAPLPILRTVSTTLGLDFEEAMLVPARSRSHSVLGNDMRLDPARLESIVYDSRWLTRREWVRPARMFRGVMRYNAAEVYSNSAALPWG